MKHIVEEIAGQCEKQRLDGYAITRDEAMLNLSMLMGEIHRCYLDLQYGNVVNDCRVLVTETELKKYQMRMAVLNLRLLAGDFR